MKLSLQGLAASLIACLKVEFMSSPRPLRLAIESDLCESLNTPSKSISGTPPFSVSGDPSGVEISDHRPEKLAAYCHIFFEELGTEAREARSGSSASKSYILRSLDSVSGVGLKDYLLLVSVILSDIK